jgi:RNA polymerase sigma-70 factor (ECF subfamily)
MNTPSFQPSELLADHAWVRSLARSLVFDSQSVDDVVQELWLQALTRSPREATSAGWLNVSIRHVAANLRRSETRRRARELAAARSEELPDDVRVAERARLHRDLLDHVLALDEHERTVLLMRFYDDLPPRAIAKRLGVPVATVKSRLQRALAGLREDLDQEFGDRTNWGVALLPLATYGGEAKRRFVSRLLDLRVKHVVAATAITAAVGWFATARFAPTQAPVEVAAVAASAGASSGERSSLTARDAASGARALAVPDSAAPEERTRVASSARSATPGRLVVRDANGAPLAGATVRWIRYDRPVWPASEVVTQVPRGEALTDARGEIELPSIGTHAVAVEPVVGLSSLELVEIGEATELSLLPCGSLEATCVDAAGAPVAGVRVHLVRSDAPAESEFGREPLATEEPLCALAERAFDQGAIDVANELRSRIGAARTDAERALLQLEAASPASVQRSLESGADGKLVWPLLVVSDRYELRVTSCHVLADPAVVTGPGSGREGAGAAVSIRPLRAGTTAPLEIRAAARTSITMTLAAHASAFGRLSFGSHPWTAPPKLVARHLATFTETARGYVEAATVQVAADGAFELACVPAGTTELQAKWTTAADEWVVVRCHVELPAGTRTELGEIAPLEGPALEIALALFDETGAALDPAAAIAAGDALEVTAQLGLRDGSELAHSGPSFADLRVGLGRAERIFGLQPGEWQLVPYVERAPRWLDGWRQRSVRDERRFELPAVTRVECPVHLERTTELRVEPVCKSGALPRRARYELERLDADGRAVAQPAARTTAPFDLALTPGRYVLRGWSSEQGDAGHCAEATFSFPETTTLELEFTPGAALAIHLADGLELAAGRVPVLRAPPSDRRAAFEATWIAEVRSDRVARLGGLPPNTTLYVVLPESAPTAKSRHRFVEVRTGAAGSTADVVVE